MNRIKFQALLIQAKYYSRYVICAILGTSFLLIYLYPGENGNLVPHYGPFLRKLLIPVYALLDIPVYEIVDL